MKKIFSSVLMATMMISMIPLQSSALVILPGGGEPDRATVKAAFTEFKSLSKKEQKVRIKEAKKQVKEFKKEKKGRNEKRLYWAQDSPFGPFPNFHPRSPFPLSCARASSTAKP